MPGLEEKCEGRHWVLINKAISILWAWRGEAVFVNLELGRDMGNVNEACRRFLSARMKKFRLATHSETLPTTNESWGIRTSTSNSIPVRISFSNRRNSSPDAAMLTSGSSPGNAGLQCSHT